MDGASPLPISGNGLISRPSSGCPNVAHALLPKAIVIPKMSSGKRAFKAVNASSETRQAVLISSVRLAAMSASIKMPAWAWSGMMADWGVFMMLLCGLMCFMGGIIALNRQSDFDRIGKQASDVCVSRGVLFTVWVLPDSLSVSLILV